MNKQFPTAACDQIAADFRGRIGFYIEDLTTGITHEYNADQRFPTASVCKVPVMIELFHQAETGNLSLMTAIDYTGIFLPMAQECSS